MLVSEAIALAADFRGVGRFCAWLSFRSMPELVAQVTNFSAEVWFLLAALTPNDHAKLVETWCGFPGGIATANLPATLDCAGSLAMLYRYGHIVIIATCPARNSPCWVV